MKRYLINRHSFLFLSILSFLLAFIFWFFLIGKTVKSRDEIFVQNISKNVNQELKKVGDEAKLIKEIILKEKEIHFSSFPKKGINYPYFVYKDKELFFWSTNTFFPSYDVLKSIQDVRFLQLRNGKYLAQRQSLLRNNQNFEIFLLLPLSYEYSVQNDYISSGLNEAIFNSFPFKLSHSLGSQNNNIYTGKGAFLFSIEVPKNHDYRNEMQMLLIILLMTTGILSFYIYLFIWLNYIKTTYSADLSFLVLALCLAGTRTVMLIFNFPFSLYEYDLFNPKFFASSSISPSIADLLINALFIVVLSWFIFKNYHDSQTYKRLLKANDLIKTFISILFSSFSFLALYLVYYTTGILSYHSRWSLDITSDIDFDIFRITSLLIFIASFVVYFINSHLIFRILIKLNSYSFRSLLIKFLIGGILFAVLSSILDEIHWSAIFINIFYFLILYYLNLPRTIGSIKYSTYIYFLVCAFVCSCIGAYSIYKENLKESIFDKQHYANDLLFKNDVFGEFLLNEASHGIENDEFIKTRLITPLTSKGLIEYKIKKAYLPNYFDKYDIIISVFDYHGNVFEKNSQFTTFKEAEDFYKKRKYKTEFSNIYFVRDPETAARKYVCFTDIFINNILVGSVLIELKHKKYVPHSVYPELLMNNVSDKPYEQRSYNYAVYSNGKLLYSFGNYNYQSNFNHEWLDDPDLYKDGITDLGFHHVGLQAPDGKKIVVSSDKYYFKRIFSNFSFFFLILTLFTLIFIIFYAQNFSKVKINTTYATKIQIYLNIAFFLPLLIVSVTTLSIISVSYRDSLNHAFVNKAEDISAHITGYFHDNKIDTGKDDMENIIMEISKFTETDINVYSNKGRLLFTNQPMIFELGLLSKLINPNAYSSLIENSSTTLMSPEKVGNLKYNCVYVSMRSIEDNELLGVLSMPFFESKNELDKQIIHVLTTIVNIFVTIFILFLILSYFASHVLTVPLKIITQKLRKTTLDKNEPIEWKTNDEIGMLVGEYNSMLVKLEESKNALSKSEKESAWREMAKQVAHEIKNPLTPMKLTIQHLQRSVDGQDQDLAGKTKKALTVILDQVNNLNEIATSFSMFAKMPIPKTERFEITSVLSKTAALHNNNKDVNVHTDIMSGHYFVIGDEQLMSGIFTNLILNGIQSVPNGRTAEIVVRLSQVDSKVLIEVKDNGNGIPVSIREKVFLPNFSTKYSGSGIGLAVAKRGVEHAGGRIWFETMEGTGTSFFIEIPLSN